MEAIIHSGRITNLMVMANKLPTGTGVAYHLRINRPVGGPYLRRAKPRSFPTSPSSALSPALVQQIWGSPARNAQRQSPFSDILLSPAPARRIPLSGIAGRRAALSRAALTGQRTHSSLRVRALQRSVTFRSGCQNQRTGQLLSSTLT